MLLARLEVRPKPGVERGMVEHRAGGYISCLFRQGQVIGDELSCWVDGEFHSYVRLNGADALDRAYHSDSAVRQLQLLGEIGEFSWSQVGDPETADADWQDAAALYLAPSKFVPVRALPSGDAVPVYKLPLSHQERDEVVMWGRRAHLFDDVWLDSGRLELAAFAELASPRSYLSAGGRELAEAVEKATGKPTYYWLMRFYTADAEGEATRPCPGCGRPLEPSPWGGGDYMSVRCETCRLLTGVGDVGDTEGPEEAKIGAWDPEAQGEYPSEATQWLDDD